MKRVSIIVLGDIGRSPRMQYHALSFADNGYFVNLIGYGGSTPLTRIQSHDNIEIKHLKPFPSIDRIPKTFELILKTIWQILTLMFLLIFKQKSDFIMVQNPPAVPTLFVCWLYCLVMRSKYIVDWHNYAHTIMALNLKNTHPLVRMTRVNEAFFGARSSGSLCVSRGMKQDLETNWGLKDVQVLYDRPPEIFKGEITNEEKQNLFTRLSEENPVFSKLISANDTNDCSRPVLLVSSTSWTPDEDFSILFEALKSYDQSKSASLPELICVITGKGPMKEFYLEEISKISWNRVKIVTVWLHINDYPLLLASADFGVCLHKSSSGLDLPMKVVDMFGCSLPVLAYDYQCIGELVENDKNGFTFKTSEKLAELIEICCDRFPNNQEMNVKIGQFKRELKKFQNLRWEENWKVNVLPLLEKI